MASEQELADMERMSNDFVPDVQVPKRTFSQSNYPDEQSRGLSLDPNNLLKHS